MNNYLADIEKTLNPFDEGYYLRPTYNLEHFGTDIVCDSINREEQQAMLIFSIKNAIRDETCARKFPTVMAPTGVGKTFCVASIIRDNCDELDAKYINIVVTPDTVAQQAAEDECVEKGIKCINILDFRNVDDFIARMELYRGQRKVLFASHGSLINRRSWFETAYKKKGYVYIVFRDEAHHGAHSVNDSKDATGAYRNQYTWIQDLHAFRQGMSDDNRVFFLSGTPTNAHMDTGLASDRMFFKPIFVCHPSLEAMISAELVICEDSDEAMHKSLVHSKECERIIEQLRQKTGDERWNNNVPSTLVFSAVRGNRFLSHQSITYNTKTSEDWCIRNNIDYVKRDQSNGDSRIFRMFCEGKDITYGLFIRLGYTAISLKNPISIVDHNDSKFNPKDRTGREIINQYLQKFGRLTRPAFFRNWKEAIAYLRKWRHDAEVYSLVKRLICEFAFHKTIYVVRDSIGKMNTAMKTFEMGRINDMPKFLEIVQDYYDHHLVKNEYRSEEIVAQVRNLVSECPISKISRFQVCHIIPHADINNGLVKYEETVGNYIPLCDTIHKMFDDRLFYFQYDGDVLRIQLSPSLLERDKSDLHHAGVIDGAKVELPYRLSDECLAYRKNMVING